MHSVADIEPEMGIGMPLGFGEAEIKDPFRFTDGLLAEFDDSDTLFTTTTDELFDRDLQMQAVEHNQICPGQVLHIPWRWLKGM